MKKKNYVKPSIETVDIVIESLLASMSGSGYERTSISERTTSDIDYDADDNGLKGPILWGD